MNIKHFEAQLNALCPEKFGKNGSIPTAIQQKWINTVREEIFELCKKNWDEISETLYSFDIKGIDDDVIIASASIIATNCDTDMATDIRSSACFMVYTKKKKEFNNQ